MAHRAARRTLDVITRARIEAFRRQGDLPGTDEVANFIEIGLRIGDQADVKGYHYLLFSESFLPKAQVACIAIATRHFRKPVFKVRGPVPESAYVFVARICAVHRVAHGADEPAVGKVGVNPIDGLHSEEVRIELTDRDTSCAMAEVIGIPANALVIAIGEEMGLLGPTGQHSHSLQSVV